MSCWEVLEEIGAWTSSAYRQGRLLSGIIFLTDINRGADGLEMEEVETLQELCGPSALQNVLLTTTKWSKLEDYRAQQESYEKDLRDTNYLRELVTKGAAIERFLGTRESGFELIHKLMNKEPKPLLIQHQMVEKNMTLAETDVGSSTEELNY